MKKAQGFTLIEVMIAITIIGLVLALALPNFREFLQNNRTSSQANDIIAMIALGKSEALGRGRPVQVLAGTGDWSDGYVMTVDIDRNGVFTDADDEVIVEYEAPSQATLLHGGGDGEIIFRSNGLLASGLEFTLRAENCFGENNRLIEVSRTGTVRITRNPC